MTTRRKKTAPRAAEAEQPIPSAPQAEEASALPAEAPAEAAPQSPEGVPSPAQSAAVAEAVPGDPASHEGAPEAPSVPGAVETCDPDGAGAPAEAVEGVPEAEEAFAAPLAEAAEDEEAFTAARAAGLSPGVPGDAVSGAPEDGESPETPEAVEAIPDGLEGTEPCEDASLAVMEDSLRHGRRVAVIAATLFQDLMELHGLSDEWGHRLHHAALLHDIGFVEGKKGHHKASMRRIEENAGLGLPDEEKPFVALLARYHRKAWPSRRHARFAALKKRDQKALRKAAAILRIADALDYGHAGAVGPLAVTVRKRRVILAVQCRADCSAEVRRVGEKSDLFRHVFGRKVECLSLHD